MKYLQKLLVLSVILLSCISIAQAATFTVNSNMDVVDAAPGNGVCATAAGVCTLRAAIQEANALAGADTINLPAGVYLLANTGSGENAAATGDLDITGSLKINGAGADLTIISGLLADRIFHITTSFAAVGISGMSLINGAVAAGHGGCINSASSQLLTLSNVKFKNCLATAGAGGGLVHTGAALIKDSDISNSVAASYGGLAIIGDGNVTIEGTTISNSVASTGSVGGLTVIKGTGDVTIKNSVITENSSTTSSIGGLFVSLTNGSFRSYQSEISNNHSHTAIGGMYVGVLSSGNSIEIDSTTIKNNRSITSSYGGMYLSTNNANISINNSNLSNNSATTEAGLGYVNITAAPGEFSLTNSTISKNTALGGNYGGIYAQTISKITVSGSIFSENLSAAAIGAGMFSASNGSVVFTNNNTYLNNAVSSVGGIGIAANNSGSILVENSSFTNNISSSSSVGALLVQKAGGSGATTVRRSLFAKNVAISGSAFLVMTSATEATLENSTVSENTGVLFGATVFESPNTTIRNNTFVKNKVSFAPVNPASLISSVATTNTTVVGNIFDGDASVVHCGNSGGATTVSAGNNIINNTSCFGNVALGDLQNTDPQLQALANNGGPTLTHAIFPGSPAIDKFSAGCPANDQRGVARPQDGNGDGSALCDVGAYENFDLCPFDPAKLLPGACGCGVADSDGNSNGVADCLAGGDLRAQAVNLLTLLGRVKHVSTSLASQRQRSKVTATKNALAALVAFANANGGAITVTGSRTLTRLVRDAKSTTGRVIRTNRVFVSLSNFKLLKKAAQNAVKRLRDAIVS
ncbi:MAG TPA: right-handed parallel beta-helix repeat-containing protein [Oligoflexia bacterium]|nr:right-handed parallel beta-helix repeat-containing protein [Oligoflexia bacterium]HMP26885.1 right-handed parallel beta-helix repeat-containing protein [Oligoflexia bacterium]